MFQIREPTKDVSPQTSTSACGGNKHDGNFLCQDYSPYMIISLELNDINKTEILAPMQGNLLEEIV